MRRLVVPEDDEWPALPLHCLTVATAGSRADRPRPARPHDGPGAAARAVGARSGAAGRARRPVGGDRRVAGVHRLRRARRRRARPRAGRARAGPWCPAAPSASTRPRTAARWPPEAPTVAVLACGVDRPYPAAHGALFARIAEDGPAGQRVAAGLRAAAAPLPGPQPADRRPDPRHGRRRGGGAVRCAGDRRPGAAARPGGDGRARAGDLARCRRGCHELLRDASPRSTLVTSAAHVVEAVGGLGDDLADRPQAPADPRDGLAPLARQVLDGLPTVGVAAPDRIAAGRRSAAAGRAALPARAGAGGLRRGDPDRLATRPRRPPQARRQPS